MCTALFGLQLHCLKGFPFSRATETNECNWTCQTNRLRDQKYRCLGLSGYPPGFVGGSQKFNLTFAPLFSQVSAVFEKAFGLPPGVHRDFQIASPSKIQVSILIFTFETHMMIFGRYFGVTWSWHCGNGQDLQ